MGKAGGVRTGLGTAEGTCESSDFSKSRHLIVLLKVAKFADNAGIVGEGNYRVNTLSCIHPRLDGRDTFGKYLGMKVLILL